MRKGEKQVIVGLTIMIIVVAVALVMLLRGNENESSDSSNLKEAVQQEASDNDEEDTTTAEDETETSSSTEDTTEDATTEVIDAAESDEEETQLTAAEIMDADDGYVFPESDSSYLSSASISELSTTEIQYAINEIYARHGLKFTKAENRERFEKKKWYTGTVDDQDDITLNDYEKENVNTMASILKKRGAR